MEAERFTKAVVWLDDQNPRRHDCRPRATAIPLGRGIYGLRRRAVSSSSSAVSSIGDNARPTAVVTPASRRHNAPVTLRQSNGIGAEFMRSRQWLLAFASASALPFVVRVNGISVQSRQEVQPTIGADARRALSGAWVFNETLSDKVPRTDVAGTLVLTVVADTATFYQPDGSRHVYHLSRRRERQDLGSGIVWSTAVLDGPTLKLQFKAATGLQILQTFFFDRRTRQLIVTTSLSRPRLPMSAVRLVYDALIERGL